MTETPYVWSDRDQKAVLAYVLSDTEVLELCRPYLNPEHFSNLALNQIVRLLIAYHDHYKSAPGWEIVTYIDDMTLRKVLPDKSGELLKGICEELLTTKLGNRDFVIDHFDSFLKHIAFVPALQDAAELGRRGQFEEAVERMQTALANSPRGKRTKTTNSSEELIDMSIRKPLPPIVHGLLRRGEICNIVGAPKARKSFLAMQLALCIATGEDFLGFKCEHGKVKIFDFEMFKQDLGTRLGLLTNAMNIDPKSLTDWLAVESWYLEEKSIDDIETTLNRDGAGKWNLVIVDSLYRALPDWCDENSNSDMRKIYGQLSRIAARYNTALLIIHHSSKGNQSDKEVHELGAGAGAQSRATYVHVGLRAHDAKDAVTMDVIARGQKPIESRVLVWNDGLWTVDRNLNPRNLKSSGKRKADVADIYVNVPVKPADPQKAMPISQLRTYLHGKLPECSQESINAALVEAESIGLLERVELGRTSYGLCAVRDKNPLPEHGRAPEPARAAA